MEKDLKSKTFLQFHQKKINLLLFSASMHMKQILIIHSVEKEQI